MFYTFKMTRVQTVRSFITLDCGMVFSLLLLTVLSEPCAKCAQRLRSSLHKGSHIFAFCHTVAFSFRLTGILIDLGENR